MRPKVGRLRTTLAIMIQKKIVRSGRERRNLRNTNTPAMPVAWLMRERRPKNSGLKCNSSMREELKALPLLGVARQRKRKNADQRSAGVREERKLRHVLRKLNIRTSSGNSVMISANMQVRRGRKPVTKKTLRAPIHVTRMPEA